MYRHVNSFFVTKLAKQKSEELIDPGEAAAAGMALASGPIAQSVIPTVGSYLAMKLGPQSIEHTGVPLEGRSMAQIMDRINHLPLTGRIVVTPNSPRTPHVTPTGKKILNELGNKTFKIFNLFDVKQSPKKWWQTVASPAVANLYPVSKSIDSMIIKNKLDKKGLKLELTSGPMARLMGPYYDPHNKRVVLPWLNKPYALHEIGHAAHLAKPGARTFDVMRQLLNKGTAMAIPMAYLAGNEIKDLIPGRLDDKVIDFVQNNAPSLMAGTYIGASVYPEMQATARAVNHIYKTEGPTAARKTLKALLPALSTYLIPIVPTLVGLALAKKYFFNAKKEQKKEAGLIRETIETAKAIASESSNVLMQMGKQTGKLLDQPGKEIAERLYHATKANMKSPSFAYGAVMSGIPALATTYVLHNTPEGKLYSERERQIYSKRHGRSPIVEAQIAAEKAQEEKRHDSVTFPALVGMGAAVSGGFLTKLLLDLYRVL